MTSRFLPPSDRKPFFDRLRRRIGRAFRQGEVDLLDAALDTLGNAPCPRTISAKGLALIKRFEGCARLRADGLVEAYPDPATGADPWTIGWGATGPGIGPGTIWTQQQCDRRLEQDIARHARDVRRALGETPTSQAQFDALVSFHYNTGAIGKATLTMLHKAGDHAGAQEQFHRWNRAGGRILKGLVRRRRAEAELYAA